jgi:hypothetical protein
MVISMAGADGNNANVIYVDSLNRIFIVDGSEDVFMSSDGGASFNLLASNVNGVSSDVGGFVSVFLESSLSFSVRNCTLGDCSDGVWQSSDDFNFNWPVFSVQG